MYEAQNDLEHARNDLRYKFYNWACFSAQQGAEKALKAVFQKMGAEAWGHSATGLLEELSTRVKVEAGFITRMKPQGLLNMERESSISVRVFYPKFDAQWVIDTLKQKMEELKGLLPISEVVLFGSYAQGNYTIRSDVDLLILYRGKSRKDAYSIVRKVLGIPHLELHIYTEDEARRMEGIIHRMKRAGKVIYKETPKKRS